MTASVLDMTTGDTITTGLQGCSVCDEALRVARRIAADRGVAVELIDDDGRWRVAADGSCSLLGDRDRDDE